MTDIYVPLSTGGTVYFAQPDALKVRASSRREETISKRKLFVVSGEFGGDVARSEADDLLRRAASLGENLREDAGYWQTNERHQKDDFDLVCLL